MPREYKRKHPDHGRVPPDVMQLAVNEVNGGESLRAVAKRHGIARGTLRSNMKKAQLGLPLQPNYSNARVFSQEKEDMIVDYLIKCSNMFHGLTARAMRSLVYDLAKENKMTYPANWDSEGMAGKEWYLGFMRRHAEKLTLRQPEATSLARATAFNQYTVGTFFNLLEQSYEELSVSGAQIFNLDETGITTVHKVPKVIAPKGVKQVGQVTSGERGELVTMCCVVSASGQSIPPVFVFPRKNLKNCMMNGAPEGSLGLVHQSGWMTKENFPHVLKHIKHTRPSEDHPIIITMDNHKSHISYEALELAKSNNIRVVTLPPHTSNKTQPLDRTVFGPMKAAFSRNADSWMLKNPGKRITIYQLAELGGDAFVKAATPANITAGFRVSGTWPLNKDAFDTEEYLPSVVTDRPPPPEPQEIVVQEEMPGTSPTSTSLEREENNLNEPASTNDATPSTNRPGSSSSTNFAVTPEEIRAYPKAPARKESSRGRKRGKTMIATSTPDMKRIREDAEKKAAKSKKAPQKRLFEFEPVAAEDDSASDTSLTDIIERDNELMNEGMSEDDSEEEELKLDGVVEKVRMNEYVVCEFAKKTHKCYYIGCVVKEVDDDGDIEVDFLRRRGHYFIKPIIQDISSVHMSTVKAILPAPTARGTTTRTKGELVFSVLFGTIDLR